MTAVLCIAIGYVIGTMNWAYLMGKLKGFDIRQYGSGNAGASNVVLMIGKMSGLICAVLDIFKGFAAFRIAQALFPMEPYAGILAGAACILGHIFPVWMHFAGGKGLASLGGVLLAYSSKLFFLMLAAEVVLVLVTDYICVVAITASAAFPVIYFFQTFDWIGAFALSVIAVIVFRKHKENLDRIREGKEVRVSYLWRKDAEVERLREKYTEEEEREILGIES